jgi:hypothetical protein
MKDEEIKKAAREWFYQFSNAVLNADFVKQYWYKQFQQQKQVGADVWAKALDDIETCLIEAPIDFLGTGSNGKQADKDEKEWNTKWQSAIKILKSTQPISEETIYDLVAGISYGGFLSDRITFEEATKRIKAALQQNSAYALKEK